MGVPQVYRNVRDNIIATYNYFDIAEGTGSELFYAATARETTTPDTVYILTGNQLYSNDNQLSTAGTTTYTFKTSLFNLPKTIKGSAYISGSYGVNYTGGSGTKTCFLDIKLQKYDGSSASDLGESRTDTVSSTGGIIEGSYCVKIDISETNLKKGEQIYLLVEVNVGGGATGYGYLGTDPQNRDGTNLTPSTDAKVTTTLSCYIPFKIDT